MRGVSGAVGRIRAHVWSRMGRNRFLQRMQKHRRTRLVVWSTRIYARLTGLELQQAKAEVGMLDAVAQLKDEAFQAKASLWLAMIRSKDGQLSHLQQTELSKDD